jgi:hypothetical protein
MTTEIRVHYSTGKRGQPATAWEVSFASLEDAKNKLLPSGYTTAFIFVEDGFHFYDGKHSGFGWQFHEKAA